MPWPSPQGKPAITAGWTFSTRFSGQTRKGRAEARLARFYGINPYGLTAGQKLALERQMDGVWAEEQLRDHGGQVDADTLRRLLLLATGDEDAAEDAWCRRVREEEREKSRRGY